MPVHGRRAESDLKIEIALQRFDALRCARQAVSPGKDHVSVQAVGPQPRRRVERRIVGDSRYVGGFPGMLRRPPAASTMRMNSTLPAKGSCSSGCGKQEQTGSVLSLHGSGNVQD
jgi:hypothetical protein